MVQPQILYFAQFVKGELHKLCQEKRTGTLFIASVDNRLVQFGLDQGQIVFVSCQNKRGPEALLLLQEQNFKVSVTRFVEGQSPVNRLELPPTDQILQQLEGGVGRLPAMGDPASRRTLGDKAKTVLEQELVEFIGPMAAIICEETWNSVGELEAALEVLSRELPDPGQVARFRQNVLNRLA
jgi:hypothetical protein